MTWASAFPSAPVPLFCAFLCLRLTDLSGLWLEPVFDIFGMFKLLKYTAR